MKYQTEVDGHRKERGVCGKVVFDKKTAQTKKNWLMTHGVADDLRIYPCKRCAGWHLTSSI